MGSGSSAATLVGNVVAINRLVRRSASAFLMDFMLNNSYIIVWATLLSVFRRHPNPIFHLLRFHPL